MILAQGRRRDERGTAVPAWSGRRAWEDSVQAALVSLDGSMLLRRIHVSARAVMAVALHDARTATATSGGDVATAHETVGRALRVSKSVVVRARRWLREMRLSVTVAEGRYLTKAERAAAGGRQIRAAATRVLTHPPGHPPSRRRASRDYLPAKRVRPRVPPVPERSPSGAVDNSKAKNRDEARPLWAQRLAARLVEYRPRIITGRHIANLVQGLMDRALPPGITAHELLDEIDFHGPPEPSTPIRDPLKWFLHQVRTVQSRILDRWDKPTAPLDHVHDYRAILAPGILGCLTCPDTKETNL